MPDAALRETNKAVARQIIAAWNERGETPPAGGTGEPAVRAALPGRGRIRRTRQRDARGDAALPGSAFADQQCTEEMVIADDRHVFIGWELRATRRAEMFGIQPTGPEVVVFGSDVIRLAAGKIIQRWDYYPKARLPACRLPPAACRLPPAACRLPPAACRLPPAAWTQLGLLDRDLQRQLIREGLLGRNRMTGQARI